MKVWKNGTLIDRAVVRVELHNLCDREVPLLRPNEAVLYTIGDYPTIYEVVKMGYSATCDICGRVENGVSVRDDPNWELLDLYPETSDEGLLICSECDDRLKAHYKKVGKIEDADMEDDGDDE